MAESAVHGMQYMECSTWWLRAQYMECSTWWLRAQYMEYVVGSRGYGYAYRWLRAQYMENTLDQTVREGQSLTLTLTLTLNLNHDAIP